MVAAFSSDHPIDHYLTQYLGVTRFKQLHVGAACVAFAAGAVIGYLAVLAFSNGVLPFDLGQVGNIVASIAAGSVVASVAIVGILIHYALKISEKYEKSSEEEFFNALMDPSTAKLFAPESDDGMVAFGFRFVLATHFPDSNWKGMMRYFDLRFFKPEDAVFDQNIMSQVYDTFFKANPIRFLELYGEMKENKELSDASVKFLDQNYLQCAPEKMSSEDLEEFLSSRTNIRRVLLAFDAEDSKTPAAQETFKTLFETNFVDFLLTYCELHKEKKLIKEVQDSIDPWIQNAVSNLSTEQWGEIICAVEQAYFRKKTAVTEEIKFFLLSEIIEIEPIKFFDAYLKVMGSCSETFRNLVEEKFIYQESFMKAAWEKLYERNKELFLLKYFELKAAGKFSQMDDAKYETKIVEVLQKQTYKDWSKLMQAVDQTYFQKEKSEVDEKTKYALLNKLIERDSAKFLCAYYCGHLEFSQNFCKPIEDNLSKIKEINLN